MCNQPNTTNDCSCLTDILETIVCLQNKKEQLSCLEGCDKPFLGPVPSLACFNTRPVQFYACCNGATWTLPYTLNGTTGTSSIFRVESVDGCCCTCRILAPNPAPTSDATGVSPYVATDSFATINLNCVSALNCLNDVYVPCV